MKKICLFLFLVLTFALPTTSVFAQSDVIVAVIDTGVDLTHRAFANAIWTNDKEIPNNGIDDDKNGYVDDVHGWNFYHNSSVLCSYNEFGAASLLDNDNHGTHVAGIIYETAKTFDTTVQIMPLKVTGGEKGTGKTASLIKAIRYAYENGASICNISLNSSIYNEELFLTMQQTPMLFICSAGNTYPRGKNTDLAKTYPASFQLPNVISVGAVNQDGNLLSYSNYGSNSIELVAKGDKIYSTLVGNRYGYFTGTSMATPFVSGTAAVLATMDQDFYPSEIRSILLRSVNPSNTLTNKIASGGILDSSSAVLLGQTTIHTVDTTAPTLRLNRTKKNVSIQASDKQSGIKAIRYQTGKQKASSFKKGQAGKKVTSLCLSLKKGTYTFYVIDHAGNETIKMVQIP